ncbi:hypothetical protein MRX96_042660 [Rhipicephalus microplus]
MWGEEAYSTWCGRISRRKKAKEGKPGSGADATTRSFIIQGTLPDSAILLYVIGGAVPQEPERGFLEKLEGEYLKDKPVSLKAFHDNLGNHKFFAGDNRFDHKMYWEILFLFSVDGRSRETARDVTPRGNNRNKNGNEWEKFGRLAGPVLAGHDARDAGLTE